MSSPPTQPPSQSGIYTPTMQEFVNLERRLNPSPKQLGKPSHWMKLPEPPKGNEDANSA